MKSAKLILTGCLLILFSGISVFGWSQELSGADDSALVGFRRSLTGLDEPGPGQATPGATTERGTLAAETIKGNGTRAGYILGHGSIIPNSETVTVDGSLMGRNKDYFLDVSSGSIMFAQPVKKMQSIRVNYRYSQDGNAKRTAFGGPALALNFGSNASAGLMYAYTADGNGTDSLTYGLNLTTKFGSDSSMSNMMYISSPRESGRESLSFGQQSSETAPQEDKKDHLLVNSADLKAGKVDIKINYQDVGKDFAGFTALRQGGALPLDKLNQLEKEKGLQRMGFSAQSSTGALAWNSVEDDGGSITNRSLNLGSGSMKLSMNLQDVDKNFKRFNDLAEANRGQLAKEVGMSRRNYSLSFSPGKGAAEGTPWNALNMNDIVDDSGKVTLRSLNFAGKGFGISATESSVEDGFKRLASLSPDDVNNIGLGILREFKSDATAANITDQDRQHILSQTGIERQNLMGNLSLGSAALSLQSLSVGDSTGGVDRRVLSLAGKDYSVKWLSQDIDDGFTGITRLAPIERQNFANERGMSRTNLTGDFKLGEASKLAAYMSTIDDSGAGVSGYGLSWNTKNLNVAADLFSIDKGFNRVGDIVEADRLQMALRIRRQFDPNATLQSLTDDDKRHILSDTDIERQNIRTDFHAGNSIIKLQSLSTGNESGQVDRRTLSLEGKNLNFRMMLQDIDEGFKDLGRLAPAERMAYGNEYGMSRTNLQGDYAFGSGMKLNARMSRVNTGDAGLSKYGLSLSAAKYSLSANYQDIDPTFTRILDLADPDKGRMAMEQGMKRYDLTTHLQAGKSVAIDSFFYDAKHSVSDLFKRQFTNTISLNPSHGPHLSLFRDSVSSGSSISPAEFLHQTLAMNHRMGGVSLNAVMDSVEDESPEGQLRTVDTQTLHLDTDPAKKMALVGDMKRMKASDGRFEDILTTRLTSRVSDSLTFIGFRSTSETNEKEMISEEYGLAGKLFGGMDFAVKAGETTDNGKKIGRVHELRLIPAGPKDCGSFKQLNWSLSLSELVKPGEKKTQANGAKLSFHAFDHTFAAEYNSAITKETMTPIARAFKLASDPDPKKALHYEFSYKSLDPVNGPDCLVRRYGLDWRISDTTNLAYNYTSYNEKDGKLEPLGLERYRLTTKLWKKLDFIGQWENKSDYQKREDRMGMSFGFSGKLSQRETLEALYGVDRVSQPNAIVTARNYRFKYDRQIDADHFLTLTGNITDWAGPHTPNPNIDDVQIQLDFKTVWN